MNRTPDKGFEAAKSSTVPPTAEYSLPCRRTVTLWRISSGHGRPDSGGFQPCHHAAPKIVIPSMTTSALSRDTYSVFFRCASLFFTDQNSFLCDQGSCSNHSVKPLWFHHPSIRSRTATMITFSNSPTLQGGRMPTQTNGLNHDHTYHQEGSFELHTKFLVTR
jgi:hypothetical protein